MELKSSQLKKTFVDALPEDEDILIATKDRPNGQRILAAVCFTFAIAVIYVPISFFGLNLTETKFRLYLWCIVIAVFLCSYGIHLAVTKDYYFDLKNRRYKIVKRIGFVEVGKWKDFKNLNYISVFKNGNGFLQVNLWYNKNKHFNLGTAENLEVALIAGKKIATKLQINLWDAATDPYHGKWFATNV